MSLPVTTSAQNDSGILKDQPAPPWPFFERLAGTHLVSIGGCLHRVAEGMHGGEISFVSRALSCMWHGVVSLEREYPVGRVDATSPVVGFIGEHLREDIADPDHDASRNPAAAAIGASESVSEKHLRSSPIGDGARPSGGQLGGGCSGRRYCALPKLAGDCFQTFPGRTHILNRKRLGDSSEGVSVDIYGAFREPGDQHHAHTIAAAAHSPRRAVSSTPSANRAATESLRAPLKEPLTGRQLVADPAGRLGVDANPHAGPIQGSRQ